MNKKTLVLGASENPSRYSNMAVFSLRKHKHDIVAIGRKPGHIDDVEIMTGMPRLENIDTVTMYLNQTNQQPYYDYIIGLKPKRIIFNPGAENDVLEKIAHENGIETIEACTLVLLSIGNY